MLITSGSREGLSGEVPNILSKTIPSLVGKQHLVLLFKAIFYNVSRASPRNVFFFM